MDILKKPFMRPAWTCTLIIGILDSVIFVYYDNIANLATCHIVANVRSYV